LRWVRKRANRSSSIVVILLTVVTTFLWAAP
jgi:hypothetical protein